MALKKLFATALLLLIAGIPLSKENAAEKENPAAAQESKDAARGRTLIGMQYEAFFTPHNVNWEGGQASGSIGLYNGTQEAVPILGKYSSNDPTILRKHEAWFEDVGIDWLLLDWTNFLISKPQWETQTGPTHEVVATTDLLFKTYRELEKEGKHPPKFVFMMPPFDSAASAPEGIERLNHLIAWTTERYLKNPEYKDRFLQLDGKPLMNVAWWTSTLATPGSSCSDLRKITDQIKAPRWTVRWMGTQLQDSRVNECGFWSWMDGTIRQAVTLRNGAPEETIVTPSSFPYAFTDEMLKVRKGWLDPKAVGRDHGAPYLESWKVAFESHPRVIQIHQWNEFSGQTQGMGPGVKADIYGDEYNVELSDDLEPTQLDGCGFRGCGGWGYYYLNLTKALISLYRRETPDITVLALSGPAVAHAEKGPSLHLTWTYVGEIPSSYTLKLDGRSMADKLKGGSFDLDLRKLAAGKHVVSLVANGVHTYFDLDARRLTQRAKAPLPVESSIEFTYAP
jgi:hypothetical protein